MDIFIDNFESDRDFILHLSDRDAEFVLALLDDHATIAGTPPKIRAAFSVAGRIPDVARYFLVEKTRKYGAI